MSDKDYSQLTSATTASDSDLLAIYPTGGPLKKLTWSTFKSLVITALGSTYLTVANNLSDLASAAAARANLGLGSVATLAASAVFQVSNNLSEVANANTARDNIGACAKNAPMITGGMDLTGRVLGNVFAIASTTIDSTSAELQTKAISADTVFTISGATANKSSGFMLVLSISGNAAPAFTGAQWEGGQQPTFGNGKHLIGFVNDGSVWTGAVFAFNAS